MSLSTLFPIPFDTRQLFIGEVWRDASDSATLVLENPSDGSLLAHIARGTAVGATAGCAGRPAD